MIGAVRPAGRRFGGGLQKPLTGLLDIGHGRLDQAFAVGEVIEHGAPGKTGGLGDPGVAGAGVSDFGEQLHGDIKNARARPAALGRVGDDSGLN